METKVKYPQQDGTTLKGAITNYYDMLLPSEQVGFLDLMAPLFFKPEQHLTQITMLDIHRVQQDMWFAKAGSVAIDKFNAHWNAMAAIAKADHNITLYTVTERRKLF